MQGKREQCSRRYLFGRCRDEVQLVLRLVLSLFLSYKQHSSSTATPAPYPVRTIYSPTRALVPSIPGLDARMLDGSLSH